MLQRPDSDNWRINDGGVAKVGQSSFSIAFRLRSKLWGEVFEVEELSAMFVQLLVRIWMWMTTGVLRIDVVKVTNRANPFWANAVSIRSFVHSHTRLRTLGIAPHIPNSFWPQSAFVSK